MTEFVHHESLRHAWHPVAESADVATDRPHGVQLLGERLVVWRAPGGDLAAAPDRCPHREAPLTAGPDECRAWTIRRDTVARAAAGKIHSDIERGFIRAEVIAFADFDELESEAKCKDAGKLRLEGKDYVVRDGDIINFRFNV